MKQEDYQTLRNQLDIWNSFSQYLKIGTWERNFETQCSSWNQVTKQLLDLPADFEPDMTPALNFYKEGKDRELAKKSLEAAFVKGKDFDFQAHLVTAKRREIKVRVLGFCKFENNICKKMYGTFQPIQ